MDQFVPGKLITETLRDTVKVPNKKAKMIAHRGLCGLELENTNASFVAAGQRSFYGVETDTQRTKDGYFIAFHDGELNGMMGVDAKVCDLTLAELQQYRMKDYWEKRTRSDLFIPTLDEYIRICKHYNKVCFLEIKGKFSDQDITDLIALIKEEDYLDNIVFISGDWDNLMALRRQLPDHPAQLGCGKVEDTGADFHIRVVGVNHGAGGRLIQEGRYCRIQSLVTARQGNHTIDGTAALLDADSAKGNFRVSLNQRFR